MGPYCFPSFPHGLGILFLPFQPARLFFFFVPFPVIPASLLAVILPCWPIGFITYFFGLPQPIYFFFSSNCAHGPTGCHSCHVSLLGLLHLFLGFLGPFTSSLPLIVPISLLVVIFCHVDPLGLIPHFLGFPSYLLYLFLLLRL